MHKNSLGCTLRYLKYICLFNLMCFTHSFNTVIFTCSPIGNSERVWLLCYAVDVDYCASCNNKGWDHVIPQYNKHFKIWGLLSMH